MARAEACVRSPAPERHGRLHMAEVGSVSPRERLKSRLANADARCRRCGAQRPRACPPAPGPQALRTSGEAAAASIMTLRVAVLSVTGLPTLAFKGAAVGERGRAERKSGWKGGKVRRRCVVLLVPPPARSCRRVARVAANLDSPAGLCPPTRLGARRLAQQPLRDALIQPHHRVHRSGHLLDERTHDRVLNLAPGETARIRYGPARKDRGGGEGGAPRASVGGRAPSYPRRSGRWPPPGSAPAGGGGAARGSLLPHQRSPRLSGAPGESAWKGTGPPQRPSPGWGGRRSGRRRATRRTSRTRGS